MLARLAIAGLLAGVASVVAAQEFKENPIGAGAWVYPSEKIAPATVSAFCASGFSMHFADGGFFSVLSQPVGRGKRKKSTIDTIGRCSFDVEKQVARCLGEETDGRRKFKLDEEVRFERDGEHMKVSTSFIDRDTKERVTFVSYPVRCPDNVVRDILSKAIPAK